MGRELVSELPILKIAVVGLKRESPQTPPPSNINTALSSTILSTSQSLPKD